jgi:hypothetical protein
VCRKPAGDWLRRRPDAARSAVWMSATERLRGALPVPS